MGWYLSHVLPPLVTCLVAGALSLRAYTAGHDLLLPGLGFVAGLLLLLDGARRAHRRLRAMDELVAGAIRIARGQRGVLVPVHGRGELAGLAHVFNYMSQRLERRAEPAPEERQPEAASRRGSDV